MSRELPARFGIAPHAARKLVRLYIGLGVAFAVLSVALIVTGVAAVTDVLAEAGGDRKSAFFRRFFSVAPSQFVRQPLRKQCETTLNVVIAELDKLDPKHALRAFAPPLSSLAKAALKALDARNKAKGERTTGSNDVDEWKEGVNALRLTTYAELLKIAADKGYSRAWAESFFPADASAPDEPAAPEAPAKPDEPAKPETP